MQVRDNHYLMKFKTSHPNVIAISLLRFVFCMTLDSSAHAPTLIYSEGRIIFYYLRNDFNHFPRYLSPSGNTNPGKREISQDKYLRTGYFLVKNKKKSVRY